MSLFPFRSLFFAPMEGITDEAYRSNILTQYPEWDFVATDFLRISSSSKYPLKHYIEHMGTDHWYRPEFRQKTLFQILVAENSLIDPTMDDLNELEVAWLDLNLGCPSKTVTSNGGGSFLLSNEPALRKIIQTIRKKFKGRFTVKMRLGFRDTSTFEENLRMLEGEGVEAITIHARTRDQLYNGRADWSFIKTAVQTVKTPIIGNGDIWNLRDAVNIFLQTGCHSIMMGRSATKTPWFAQDYRDFLNDAAGLEFGSPGFMGKLEKWEPIALERRAKRTANYFHSLAQTYANHHHPKDDETILKRLKANSRYIFDDFAAGEEIRKEVMRIHCLRTFLGKIQEKFQ